VAEVSRPSAGTILRRVIAAIPAKWWILVGAAVLLGASALFGGLDEADSSGDALPVLSPGETFVADELTTTVMDAQLTGTLPNSYSEPDEGNRFIAVAATVTNNFRNSTSFLDDVLVLDILAGDPDLERPRVFLVSDGTTLPQAPPRVPVDLLFVWEVPEGMVTDGEVISLTVRSRSYFTQNSVTYGDRWQDPVAAATIDLRITEIADVVEEEDE
jgi:hypothetical protein